MRWTAIDVLVSLRGIGRWTAEMILLFCLQRPDVFSFEDLAIQRGLRILYRHRRIDRKLFEGFQPVLLRREPVSMGCGRRSVNV